MRDWSGQRPLVCTQSPAIPFPMGLPTVPLRSAIQWLGGRELADAGQVIEALKVFAECLVIG